MSARANLFELAPEGYRHLAAVEAYLKGCGLEPQLMDLLKMRASQINGCAFCLDMHSKDARKLGETEQRLYLLNAWRETNLYTERERAALAWTEHLTRISTDGAPEDAYQALAKVFSPQEIAHLNMLIGQINLWNRVAIASALHPGALRRVETHAA